MLVSPKKGSIKAGKTFRLKVTIRAKTGEIGPKQFRVNLRSSNRQVKLPRSVVVKLKGNEGSQVVTVRATRKARGKAVITAKNGKFSARSNLTVKKACVKKKGEGSGGQLCGKTNHL